MSIKVEYKYGANAPLELDEVEHKDTARLDWLDKHCTIRVTRKGNIKIRISAETNGVNCSVLRDYIDHLMEQGAK